MMCLLYVLYMCWVIVDWVYVRNVVCVVYLFVCTLSVGRMLLHLLFVVDVLDECGICVFVAVCFVNMLSMVCPAVVCVAHMCVFCVLCMRTYI